MFKQRSAHQTVLHQLKRLVPQDPLNQMLHRTNVRATMDSRVVRVPAMLHRGELDPLLEHRPAWCLVEQSGKDLYLVGGDELLEWMGQLPPEADEADLTTSGIRRWTIDHVPIQATLHQALDTMRNQVAEAVMLHQGLNKTEARARALEMFERVRIPEAERRLREYPHQMSGGMRQRIMIGMALVLNPDLLIADEPTTSLDVIVEAQFLDLLNELRAQFNLTILLISHNLGIVAQMADRITVMYGGRLAESGNAEAVFAEPRHPYTQGLLASIPNIKLDQPELRTMSGAPPDLVEPPSGCVFPRCPHVMDKCRREIPPDVIKDDHLAACWLYE